MSEAPERIWAIGNEHTGSWNDHEISRKHAPHQIEYVRADHCDALVAAAREAAPCVKPLVWKYHPVGKIAAPPTGHAYIIDTRTKGRCRSIKGFNPQREFASMDEAKAAAQADFEARVLAALIEKDADNG